MVKYTVGKKVCDSKFQINEIYNKKGRVVKNHGNYWLDNYTKRMPVMLYQLLKTKRVNCWQIQGILTKYLNFLNQKSIQRQVTTRLFFSNINLPEMSRDQKAFLDSRIRVEEIKKAISSMRVGKSPGLPRYVDKLAPILKRVYDESFLLGKLPETFNEALISLIVKKTKQKTDQGSFRPISLIRVDCKIQQRFLLWD